MIPSSVIGACLAGFAGTIAQVLVLRELLVLFCGNELSSGLIFFCWLLWTAGGSALAAFRCPKKWDPSSMLVVTLALMAVVFPLTLLGIRGARSLAGIPLGDVVPPGWMLLISMGSTGLFCLTLGALFSLTWAVHVRMSGSREPRPILVYGFEAVGAALAGLLFYYCLLPYFSALCISWMVSSAILCAAWALSLRLEEVASSRTPLFRFGLPGLVALTLAAGFVLEDLDRLSRRWQWGDALVAVEDTPYQNLALVKNEDQLTLFGNGVWLFSVPDPETEEYAVHLPLLQHPNPRRVLIIGGGTRLVGEVLKHPGIEVLDCVEPDPGVIRLIRKALGDSPPQPFQDPRVRLHSVDAKAFLTHASGAYEVILMNVGDPANASMNRFYTVEFFERIGSLLKPEGVFSFSLSAAPEILGPAQARAMASANSTLQAVFGRVALVLGHGARFLASNPQTFFLLEPEPLAEIIRQRGLTLQYFQAGLLADYLSPLRRAYARSVLEKSGPAQENRDFSPTCYFDHLIVWALQLHPRLGDTFVALSRERNLVLWGLCALGFLVFPVMYRAGRSRRTLPFLGVVALVGAAQMNLQIILLLAFQILAGFLYKDLCLIIAFFMAGTGMGAAASLYLPGGLRSRPRWVFGLQGAVGLYSLGIWGVLWLLHARQLHVQWVPPLSALFCLLSGISGVLGGLHFSLSVEAVSLSKAPSEKTGGGLYGVDLLGGSVGALVGSLLLLPLFGIPATLVLLAAACLGGLILLLPALQRVDGPRPE